MKIHRIQAKNFINYKDIDITLPESGIIGIEGINYDNPVFVSNGVGKTVFAIDMITYVLFGEILRTSRNNVLGPFGSETIISIIFKNPDMSITRVYDGKNCKVKVCTTYQTYEGTKTKVQPIIDDIIKIGWLSFQNTILFGEVKDNFLNSTDKRKKEILSEIISIGFIKDAKKELLKDAKIEETNLNNLKSDLSNLTYKYDYLNGEYTEKLITSNNASSLIQEEKLNIQNKLKKLEKELTKYSVDKSNMNNLKTEKSNIIENIDKLKIQDKNNKIILNDLQSNLNLINSKIGKINHIVSDLKEKYMVFKKDGKCPYCNTPAKKIEFDPDIIVKYNQILSKAESKELSIKTKIKETKDVSIDIYKLEKEKSDIENEIYKFNQHIIKIEEIKNQILTLKNKEITIDNKFNNLESECNTLSEELEALSNEFVKLQITTYNQQVVCNCYNVWKKEFSQYGLEAKLLKETIQKLNFIIDEYIGYLTEEKININIELNDDEINIDVLEGQKSRDFNTYSSGQKNRIERALSLALMDLIDTNINFRLLDEIDKGLPNKSLEHILIFLKEKFKEKQILFITNNGDELKKFFDYKLVVEYKDGISTIKFD